MTPTEMFRRVRATGRLWNSALVVLDAAIVVMATVAAYYARFEGVVPDVFAQWTMPLMWLSVFLYGSLFAAFGLYRLVLRFVSIDTLIRLFGATIIAVSVLLAIDVLLPQEAGTRAVPFGVLFIQAVLVFLGAAGIRVAARILIHIRAARPIGRRVLIVGAGNAGSLLLREIQNRPDLNLSVICFLDDDRRLTGRTINGVPVLGTTDKLAETVAKKAIQEVMVALPSASQDAVRAILNAAADADVQTRVMPKIVVETGSVSLRDLRPVDVEDLLGRDPAAIDIEQVRETITGKSVAVTGAAGSIGSELCRQVMQLAPARLILIEIDESRLYELWLELSQIDPDVPVMCLCDIRDPRTLDAAFERYRPELVLHAAAYKHVPLIEVAPAEAVKTNVMGTLQLMEACERHGVARFVLISTDKAVAPANMMGLTKSLAERIMLAETRDNALHAVAVRFGNVLGSRGSVVPIFEEQLRHGGPVTVTDPEVTRYFMTIPEAARLVLQAQAIGAPGDIFVLEMGEPVRIVDLARKMIALSGVPAEVRFTGLRPGEKLHERLITETESLLPTQCDRILRVDRVHVLEPDFDEAIDALVDAAIVLDEAALAGAVDRLEPGFAERASRMAAG